MAINEITRKRLPPLDSEIHDLIKNAHQEAFDILVTNRVILDSLVIELLEKETLLKDEIEKIFKNVQMISPRPAWTGSPNRTPSDLPPVALSPANSLAIPSPVELTGKENQGKPKPVRKARKKIAAADE
jgi:cell division protease FtsH